MRNAIQWDLNSFFFQKLTKIAQLLGALPPVLHSYRRLATALGLPFYDIFALQKVPFLKISDDVIACDLWFAPPPPQSKILTTPINSGEIIPSK